MFSSAETEQEEKLVQNSKMFKPWSFCYGTAQSESVKTANFILFFAVLALFSRTLDLKLNNDYGVKVLTLTF